MFHPGPALADAVENSLCASAVGDVGGRQVGHQKPPVGIDRNVAFAADDLLARVIAPLRARGRSLHRLAVDHTGRWAGFATRSEEQPSELQSLMRTSYAVFC